MMNGLQILRVIPHRAKRTQALVETNLSGIPRSTGVLRRLEDKPASELLRSTLGAMPQKTHPGIRPKMLSGLAVISASTRTFPCLGVLNSSSICAEPFHPLPFTLYPLPFTLYTLPFTLYTIHA